MTDNRSQSQHYAVDIRVLLAVIMASMAISFTIGVAMGPSQAIVSLPIDNSRVRSSEVAKPYEFKASGSDGHEPAGQVC